MSGHTHDEHTAALTPVPSETIQPVDRDEVDHGVWDRLFRSLPVAAFEVESIRGGPAGSVWECRVLNANPAAARLFGAEDLRSLVEHVEPQLRQPGMRVCIESALFEPFQTRESFGLRMIAVSGREMLLRITSTVMPAVDGAARIVLFVEDAAPIEGLRVNLAAYRRCLSELVQARQRQVEATRAALLSRDRLGEVLVEARSADTAAHMRRVAVLSEQIGARLGLGRQELADLVTAARLHDIGIVHVPTELLTRDGSVSAVERRVIQEHAAHSAGLLSASGYSSPVVEAVSQHHERVDGSGYPDRLSGDEICRAAQILGVADVMDAMTASRPYRRPLRLADALAGLARQASCFDAEVVEACRLACSGPPLARMGDVERAAMNEAEFAVAPAGGS